MDIVDTFMVARGWEVERKGGGRGSCLVYHEGSL